MKRGRIEEIPNRIMDGYAHSTARKKRRVESLYSLGGDEAPENRFVASRWRILINTNHSYEDDPEGAALAMGVLRRATEELPVAIPRHNMLRFYRWDGHGIKGAELTGESYYHLIEDYKIVFVFEKGPSNGNLHEHIDLQIDHSSCVHFRSTVFKNWIRAKLVEGGIPEKIAERVFVSFKRVPADMTHKYFSKGLRSELTLGFNDTTKALMSTFIQENEDAPFSEVGRTEVIEVRYDPYSTSS